MLAVYTYLTQDKVEHGPFQCDTEDFKKFWRRAKRWARAFVVELQDGRVYIWVPENANKLQSGWQLAKSSKKR